MSDLTNLEAAETVKIVGASSTGVESNAVNSSVNGDLFVRDILNTSVVQAQVSISTTAVECKVGASPVANRKMLMIQVTAAGFTYGFSAASQIFEISNGTTLMLNVGPNISIWVKKSSGSGNVNIAEFT